MLKLPDNYDAVLNAATFKRKFSTVRWECMVVKIEAVLNGEHPEGFENWIPEHAKKLKEDLANR